MKPCVFEVPHRFIQTLNDLRQRSQRQRKALSDVKSFYGKMSEECLLVFILSNSQSFLIFVYLFFLSL